MRSPAFTRRDLVRGLCWLGAGCVARPRRGPTGPGRGAVTIELVTNGAGGGRENVQLGLPLPPGLLDSADRVRVVDALGHELEAHTAALERWQVGEPAGAVRSVLIQLRGDFTRARAQTLQVRFDGRGPARAPLFATEDTLLVRDGAVERDPALRARFRRRFDALYARALTLDLNQPPRAYSWAFHASSQLLYFLLR